MSGGEVTGASLRVERGGGRRFEHAWPEAAEGGIRLSQIDAAAKPADEITQLDDCD